MGKLGKDIQAIIVDLAGDKEKALINLRANQVRDRFKRALETVYRDMAPLFLAHTNNVFIMDKGGVRTLIVYVDEGIYAAELNAQRELIKLHLLELFGEDIEQFEIHVSKPRYKGNHPYLTKSSDGADEKAPSIPLDDHERAYVSDTVSAVEDKQLREALQKAMTADLEWKKGENRMQT